MRYIFLICGFLFISSVYAGSLKLYNDSHIEMKASIRGRNGADLGDVLVIPGQTVNWSDTFGQSGYSGKSSAGQGRNNASMTPYTVTWRLSKTDDEYSTCTDVRTGATVTPKECRRSKK